MPEDEVWFNEEICEAYVNEQEKVTMVRSKDREMMLKSLSNYGRNEDKLQVGLGIGGGFDFKLTDDIPRVVRRIGVDYSPPMLKLCKERHPDAELVQDNLLHLRKLKKVLKKEKRPVFLTLLTNTLGNFSSEDRPKVIKSIRNVMKNNDLLVAELYKRPELLAVDPGLLPDRHLKTKVRLIDFEKGKLSEPISYLKLFPMYYYMKDPRLAWILHNMAQQEDYGDLKVVQKMTDKAGHAAYWPDTGDLVIYKLQKHELGEGKFYGATLTPKVRKTQEIRKEFEQYFKPVITSHRWEKLEIAKTFFDAGLAGHMIDGEKPFICLYIPHDLPHPGYEGKENLEEFKNRYNGLFK